MENIFENFRAFKFAAESYIKSAIPVLTSEMKKIWRLITFQDLEDIPSSMVFLAAFFLVSVIYGIIVFITERTDQKAKKAPKASYKRIPGAQRDVESNKAPKRRQRAHVRAD